jgi:hypothetical protein
LVGGRGQCRDEAEGYKKNKDRERPVVEKSGVHGLKRTGLVYHQKRCVKKLTITNHQQPSQEHEEAAGCVVAAPLEA